MRTLFWYMLRQPARAPRLALVRDGDRPRAGYSLLELERAGLSEPRARALGIPIDRTRPSALGTNIAELTGLAEARRSC